MKISLLTWSLKDQPKNQHAGRKIEILIKWECCLIFRCVNYHQEEAGSSTGAEPLSKFGIAGIQFFISGNTQFSLHLFYGSTLCRQISGEILPLFSSHFGKSPYFLPLISQKFTIPFFKEIPYQISYFPLFPLKLFSPKPLFDLSLLVVSLLNSLL